MKVLLILVFGVWSFCGSLAQTANLTSEADLVIGERLTIFSDQLGEEREVNVYLPESYHPDSLNNYPVIYVLDGSMNEDFIHIVGLVQFGSMPWIDLLPESIVVGISNVDRQRDFTFPTTVAEDKADLPTSGGSENFMNYLEEELIPFISSRYRTSDQRTIIGQSLGGLLATEILMKRPQMFEDYIIISPSLWWDQQSLLEFEIDSLSMNQVFIGVGNEHPVMRETAQALNAKLSALDANSERVHFAYFPECDHGDVLHLAVYKAFEEM
ncbi:MAG: alpha/beta hydrolase [Bacteroidetes bacterium]|nr:MAG: alpha/beta hydrolase [Bacteroidota bacterium]